MKRNTTILEIEIMQENRNKFMVKRRNNYTLFFLSNYTNICIYVS